MCVLYSAFSQNENNPKNRSEAIREKKKKVEILYFPRCKAGVLYLSAQCLESEPKLDDVL